MCDVKEKILLIQIICFSLSTVSVIATILILLFLYKFRQLEGPSVKLLLHMSLVDMIRYIVFYLFFIWGSNSAFCTFYSTTMGAALLSNSIWSLFIAHALSKFYYNFPETHESSLAIWYISAYIISPIIQIPPIFTDSYGIVDGFCVYRHDFYGYLWRGIEQGFVLIIYSIEIFIYMRVFFKFRKFNLFTFKELVFQKGMIYSIIYFFVVFFIILCKFLELYLGYCDIYWLQGFSYGLLSLHGLMNFVALMCNRNFRLVFKSGVKKGKSIDSFIEDIIQDL